MSSEDGTCASDPPMGPRRGGVEPGRWATEDIDRPLASASRPASARGWPRPESATSPRAGTWWPPRRTAGRSPRPRALAPPVSDHGYALRGGIHPDTAAVANVLAHHGVTAGHTGEPLSEAMVLGVGGGLGAGYVLSKFQAHKLGRGLVLGFFRNFTSRSPTRWMQAAFERLAAARGAAAGQHARATAASWTRHSPAGRRPGYDRLPVGRLCQPAVRLKDIGGPGRGVRIEQRGASTSGTAAGAAGGFVAREARRCPLARRAGRGRIHVIEPTRTRSRPMCSPPPGAHQAGRRRRAPSQRPSDSSALPAWRDWSRC